MTAEGGSVAFTATLTGATDAVAWTLSGPGSISPTTGSTTSYAPPASVSSATTATLTATAGTITDSVTITIDPPAAITVSGTIVSLDGQAVANASVAIGSQSATSDANGQFTISNVTTPYDLIIVVTSPDELGTVYEGLTHPDPTIVLRLNPPLPHSGAVTGNLTGGGPLGTPGETTAVAWGSPETAMTMDVAANPYSNSLSWYGPASTTGHLHALQWSYDVNDFSRLPTAYRGYGEKVGVTVANSGTTSGQDIAMTGVTAANISGIVTLPASCALRFKSMSVNFSDGAEISIISGDVTSSTTFSYLTPSTTSGTMTLRAHADDSGAGSWVQVSGLAPDASGVSLEVQAAALQLLPDHFATGITTSTDFTWTSFAGGVHIVTFDPLGAVTDPSYQVITAGTTTRIPDLSAQGLGLPTDAHYMWSITAVSPFTNVDAFAAGTNVGGFLPSAATIHASMSGPRSFDTQ